MIKSVHDYQIDDVFKKDAGFYYVIPKYQREYTWGTSQWKDFYDDICDNDYGYFIGSIICIDNSSDAFQIKNLEVVDGQQRLTTISLLLIAIYKCLKEHQEEIDEDDEDEVPTLRKSLICKQAPYGLILCPQVQNNNLADFQQIMYENGLVKTAKKEKNWGNRKIARCYKYFLQRINQDIENSANPVEVLLEIKRKVSKSVLVKIEVASHAEAYTLFESLNNRGTPLTAIDLMKNTILAKAENSGLSCDDCFDKWQELLEYLTDDYSTQERFFRQYYNAFKSELNKPFRDSEQKKKDPLGYVATRSNLLSIFEALISKNLNLFLEDILECGKIYSRIILSSEEDNKFKKALEDLGHIQGTPSYMILLYLFRRQRQLKIDDSEILKVINLLSKFFVRRNITDIPSTRDITRILMSLISEIEEKSLKGESVYKLISRELASYSASDEVFKEKLKGNIYEDNVGVARYILCALAEKCMTTETWTDLWEQNTYKSKKVYKWTIEHIFPEGNNIPQDWIDMIANGDKELAYQYLDEYVHKLGNLTITGYNSTLGNASFAKKRDRKNSQDKYVGYKNGLELNKEIAIKSQWTVEDIIERTNQLVSKALEIFSI